MVMTVMRILNVALGFVEVKKDVAHAFSDLPDWWKRLVVWKGFVPMGRFLFCFVQI